MVMMDYDDSDRYQVVAEMYIKYFSFDFVTILEICVMSNIFVNLFLVLILDWRNIVSSWIKVNENDKFLK